MKNAVKTNSRLNEWDEDNCVDIFRNTTRASHLLHQMASDVAASFGLHAAEMNVIDMLGKFGSIAMGELSRRSFISTSNTTSTVKKLEAANLVQRVRSNKSDREVLVSLTTKGKSLFRKCYPKILAEAHTHMAERLTRTERTKLAAILRKFMA